MSAEEANENDGHEASLIPINYPPPRTPLNAIPDPAQLSKSINTPRVSYGNTTNSRNAKLEPNSTSSTPCRGIYKPGSSSRKGVSSWTVTPECNYVETQQFELQEDSSFWRHHNVQVLIRIRPFNSLERITQGYGSCLRQESNQTLVWVGHPETRFTFDHVACETVSQEKLFRVAGLPMVENCMSGYNSCVFAYGQTGSGKTYTMMGDIHDMEVKLSEDCGITARIFEYLFMRIRAEEESRKDERLKYSCKCSFLEIYNEQIADLLEPSSTNLQLREDLKKGVYVENLKEYNVMTVSDIIKLLLQGAANRKIAATHMNSESSRSHSVFTCIIESQWENDSMTHFRYARLNLVDLAGSERQKTSGAEGDRLKEAANINKSLSTLGMVIMSLVDMAHGKQRHVPYRDSRLTFLLQDSLGGNSKTMIIANITPSICSANETLSTLKFAQHAKVIQNNAKVNEDASGDISALQRQIHMLKGQLSLLMNNHEPEKSFPCPGSMFQDSVFNDLPKDCGVLRIDYHDILSDQTKKLKSLEALVYAALRREKMGETTIQKFEAEIEHMNRLAHQRDEDAQRTKMLVRFREEKIKHLELLREGSFSADAYLREENSALLEEIKLLQAKIDRNPEVTQFALENIRLLEHLQMFQNFYEQGERETLLSEVSDIRDQLLQTLEMQLKLSPNLENQEGILKEKRCCKEMNSKLMWDIDELRRELKKHVTTTQATLNSVPTACNQAECIQQDYCSLVDSISVNSDPGDEVMLHNMSGSGALPSISDSMMGITSNPQPTEIQKELEEARWIIQAMESEHLSLFEKLQFLQEDNKRYVELLKNTEEIQKLSKLDSEFLQLGTLQNQSKDLIRESDSDINGGVFKAKLDSMSKDLEQVMLLNRKFQEEHLLQLSQRQQVELVCEQVETEMTKTIIHLQEEVTALQLELKERVVYMNQENIRLQDTIAGKEDEVRSLSLEWEKATSELTNFLANGSKSLNEASSQIESIVSLFSQVDVQICDQVERAVKLYVDKEQTVLLLQKNLEEAQNMVHEMEQKFNSLKGATIALNQITQLDGDGYSKETMHLKMLLNEKTIMIKSLETELKLMEDKILKAEKKCGAFTVGGNPSRCDTAAREEDKDDLSFLELPIPDGIKRTQFHTRSSNTELVSPDDITAQIEFARLEVMESENAIRAFYANAEVFFTSLQSDICRSSSSYDELIRGLVEDIQATRKYVNVVKKSATHSFSTAESLPLLSRPPELVDNQQALLLEVRDGLTETNERLNTLENSIKSTLNVFVPMMEENIYSIDSSSGSEVSSPSVTSESDVGKLFPTCFSRSPSNTSQGEINLIFEGMSQGASSPPKLGIMKMLMKDSSHHKVTRPFLKDELEMAFCAFNKLYYHLAAFCNVIEVAACSYPEERERLLPSLELREDDAETNCQRSADDASTHACPVDVKVKPASFFLTKFEEAHATIQEADYMLNALLEANEKSKELTGLWKQAGEDLMVEKASLVEQVEQLKQSTCLKDQENIILREQLGHSLIEMENLVISLEGSFLEMQKYVEDLFTEMSSDFLSVGRDILCCIFKSRSSLEGIFTEIMEKGLAFHALYQCHIGEILTRSPHFVRKPSSFPFREQESQPTCIISEDNDNNFTRTGGIVQGNKIDIAYCLEEENWEQTSDNPAHENTSLRKELERKAGLLKGLLFDFSLLQESASNAKDIRDEYEKLILTLSEAQQDLESKTTRLDSLLVEHTKLEEQMVNIETALFVSNSELLYTKETVEVLSAQNAELRMLKDDLCLRKSEAEEKLEEQMEIVKGLEKEVLHLASPTAAKFTSYTNIGHDLRRVIYERDRFSQEVNRLNDKLEMAYALADENEAIAVEARQESEASKVYAEQREEEVKILESSVEELECTINVLEKKVYEMDEELERHRLQRDSLELEVKALRQRISNVENICPENATLRPTENEISRKLPLALQEAHNQIKMLEEERANQNKEIKELKDYIAELVLHAETQASLYLQKYKSLEAMVSELKTNSTNSTSATTVLDRTEQVSARTRGSSSPFRCLTSLVQQMNLEKDQELSLVKLRIDELEALASNRHKEIFVLRSRLAAAESMTHDVIRDLLSVKLDMTSYANLIDQHQVQQILEQAQQQTEESVAKEQEILNLKMQIRDLMEERESCISGFKERKGDFLAAQISIEKLKEREQLLSAQNGMLKRDKIKLTRKVAELEQIVEEVFPTRDGQQGIQPQAKIMESCSRRTREADFSKSQAQSEQVLFCGNELAQYRRMRGSHSHFPVDRDPLETKNRKDTQILNLPTYIAKEPENP